MPPRTAFLLAASLFAAVPAAGAAPLVLCMDEQPHPPFILANGGGTVPALLREAGKMAGVEVQIYQAPLRRCWEEMRNGKAHGYTSSSESPATLEEFRFPMADGKADPSRTTALARLAVFRRKGDSVRWDGVRFHGMQRPALVPSGLFGAAERVSRGGAQADLQAKTLEQNFAKLLALRGDIVVGFENDGLELLQQRRYGGQIEKLPAPLAEVPYYMMVTQRAHDTERVMIDAMWQAIGALNAKRVK